MTISLGKLNYADLALVPKTDNLELSRFYSNLADIFKRMSSAGADRVVTVADLNEALFNPDRWVDYNIGAASLGAAASAPDLTQVASTNIYLPSFDGTATSEQLFGSIELNHDYKEGSDIFFHVHWLPTTNDAGNVKWNLDYIIMRTNVVTPTATTVSFVEAAGGVAWKMKTSELPKIPGHLLKIGDQFTFRLYRTPSDAADTYAKDAIVATVGLHVQVDGFGSRQKTTKY